MLVELEPLPVPEPELPLPPLDPFVPVTVADDPEACLKVRREGKGSQKM